MSISYLPLILVISLSLTSGQERFDTIDEDEVVNADLKELFATSEEALAALPSEDVIVERELLMGCSRWSDCKENKQSRICKDLLGNEVQKWRPCLCKRWSPWTPCRNGLTYRFCYYPWWTYQVMKCPYQCTACCPTLYQRCPWWFEGQKMSLSNCCRENACPQNQMCTTYVCKKGSWYCDQMCPRD